MVSPLVAEQLAEFLAANKHGDARYRVAGTSKTAIAHHGPWAERLCNWFGTDAFSVDRHIVAREPLNPHNDASVALYNHEFAHHRLHTAASPGVIFRAPPKSKRNELADDKTFARKERVEAKREGGPEVDQLKELVVLADALTDAIAAQRKNASDDELAVKKEAVRDAVRTIVQRPYGEWFESKRKLVGTTLEQPPTEEFGKGVMVRLNELDMRDEAIAYNIWAAESFQIRNLSFLVAGWAPLDAVYERVATLAKSGDVNDALHLFGVSVSFLRMLSNIQLTAAEDMRSTAGQNLIKNRSPYSQDAVWFLSRSLEYTNNTVRAIQVGIQTCVNSLIVQGEKGSLAGPKDRENLDRIDAAITNLAEIIPSIDVIDEEYRSIPLGEVEMPILAEMENPDKTNPKHIESQLDPNRDPDEFIYLIGDYYAKTEISDEDRKYNAKDKRVIVFNHLPGARDTELVRNTVNEMLVARVSQVEFLREIFTGEMQSFFDQNKGLELLSKNDNEDWRKFTVEFFNHQKVAKNLDDERAFRATAAFLEKYFQSFTVHPVQDVSDYARYLSRAFPRSLTGQLVHDCGVYSMRAAYILGSLQKQLGLSFHLALLPQHVNLSIMGKTVGAYVVENNNIVKVETTQLEMLTTEDITKMTGNPPDDFIGEIAVAHHMPGQNAPYIIVEISESLINSPAKLDQFYIDEIADTELITNDRLGHAYSAYSGLVEELDSEFESFFVTDLPCIKETLNGWLLSTDDGPASDDKFEIAVVAMEKIIKFGIDGVPIKMPKKYAVLNSQIIPYIEKYCLADTRPIEFHTRYLELESVRLWLNASSANPKLIASKSMTSTRNAGTFDEPGHGLLTQESLLLEEGKHLRENPLIRPSDKQKMLAPED